MRNLIQIEKMVEGILEKNGIMRCSDDLLFAEVVKQVGAINGIDVSTMTMHEFFSGVSFLGFPSYESVSRTRRKVQQKRPDLCADCTVKAFREAKQAEFLAYVRGEYNGI